MAVMVQAEPKAFTRRRLFQATIPCGGAALSLLSAQPKRSVRKPNIIYILSDDFGYADAGCYGQKDIETPHIDRMAADGMRFLDHYAGSALCAPSRCSLLTGMHTGHTPIKSNEDVLLRPQDVTFASMLRDAGYATGCIGKWGIGHPPPPGDPRRNGFDYFFGFLSMWHAHNYYPEFLWRNEEKVPLRNVVAHPKKYYKADQVDLVGIATKRVDYAPDLFAEEALRFIEKNRAQPFFLYFATTVPHANNEAPNEPDGGMEVPDYGIYAGKDWTEDRKGHAAMITRMDGDIGRLMKRLQDLGLDRDTIVFFSGDNGPHADCKTHTPCHAGNGPLRGWKAQLYEGGIRVPLIARWPGRIKAGAVSKQVCAFWDMMPTMLDLAGLKVPAKIDGLSITPTLFGEAGRQKQHSYLYWELPQPRNVQYAIRAGNWKGVRKAEGAPLELYDLSTDLGEQNDLAGKNPDVVRRLEKLMREARGA